MVKGVELGLNTLAKKISTPFSHDLESEMVLEKKGGEKASRLLIKASLLQ